MKLKASAKAIRKVTQLASFGFGSGLAIVGRI